MGMWKELVGSWTYAAGTSGTVTLPEGAILLAVRARSTAGGTVKIFGGADIPVVATAEFDREFNHSLAQAPSVDKTLVFTTTTSYYVEYLKAPGT